MWRWSRALRFAEYRSSHRLVPPRGALDEAQALLSAGYLEIQPRHPQSIDRVQSHPLRAEYECYWQLHVLASLLPPLERFDTIGWQQLHRGSESTRRRAARNECRTVR